MNARALGSILVGLILVSCGKDERRPQTVGDEYSAGVPDSVKSKLGIVLARVGKDEITYGDLRAHMLKRSSPATVDRHLSNPDIVHIGLSSLVDQFVWEHAARKAKTKLTRDEFMDIRVLETQLYANHYVAEVVEPLTQPSKEDVQKYYEEHIELFRVPARVGARHILVSTQAEAERLKKEVEGGADFAVLARKYSQDPNTRDLGGAVGYVQAGSDVLGMGTEPAFVSSVLLMEPGELAIIQSTKGWHLVKAEKKEGGTPEPLEAVYDRIASTLAPKTFGKIYNEELAKVREKVGVEYYAENLEKVTGIADSAGRLMLSASKQTDPLGKVEMYRRVAFDFPDAREAPEAQFMIGYVYLMELKDREAARKALQRLEKRFGRSRYHKAGSYLLQNLDADNPAELGSPAEILRKAGQ